MIEFQIMNNDDKFLGKYRIPSSRYRGYDYGTNGDYFVTICTENREPYFGEIRSDEGSSKMFLSPMGEIATQYWTEIPKHFPYVVLDDFTIMPDHLHGIIEINKGLKSNNAPGNQFGPQSGTLGSVIRGYKAGVKTFAVKNHIPFAWQSRFYDRIIRNYEELQNCRWYIRDNLLNWKKGKR